MTEANKVKFEIGEKYIYPGLYQGSYVIICTDRTETTITYVEEEFQDQGSITKEIIINSGKEAVLAWEYKGHVAYLYPDSDY